MTPAMHSSGSQSVRIVRSFRRLVLAPMIAGLLVSVAAGKYGGGSGIASDPYLIRTAADLDLLGSSLGDWGKCFRLMADIDLMDYNETNFHLIGYWSSWGALENRPFGGIFDGNGHTISNFRYRDMKGNGIALFRYVDVGEIRNLRIENAKVLSDGSDIGALVGRLGGGAVIDCHVTGADVTGNVRVGGLVGSVNGVISQCSSRGRVAGVTYVGGLVGEVAQGTVKRSYSKASVSGNDAVGGLAGAALNEASIVESCYASGAVDGTLSAGGLIGRIVAGRVFRSYSAGAVTGNPAGGLAGNKNVLGDVIASYWDTITSGCTTSGGGTGKTTAQMRSAASYQNWDFDTIWSICESVGYPSFWWQVPTADFRCPDGVTTVDFARFATQWRRNDCGAVNSDCEWTDLDGSGDVGIPDLAILADQWLSGLY